MAQYTAHYGLHQWEPDDAFLRADFNADLALLDANLHRAERAAVRAGYHAANLMLRQYYEGKYTGYRRALLFDGFLDAGSIAVLGDTLSLSEGALTLWGGAASAPGTAYGNQQIELTSNPQTPAYTIARVMEITGLTLRCRQVEGPAALRATVDLYVNGARVAQAALSAQLTSSYQDVTAAWTPVPVTTGDQVFAVVSGVSDHLIYAAATGLSADPFKLAGFFRITSPHGAAGALTAVPREAGGPFTRALAWARHQRGAVALSLNGTPMAPLEVRAAATLQGEACLESAFSLDAPLEDPISLSISLTRGSDSSMALRDYGVLLL